MAAVEKRKRKGRDGKTRTVYRVRYRDPAGRAHSKSFPTRPEADAYATTVEAQKLRGEYHDPSLGREKVGDFYERRWLQNAPQRLRPSTLNLVTGHWAKYVEPVFGKRRLNTITPYDVRAFVEAVHAQTGSPYQAETSLRLIRSILRAAVDDGLLARSPAADLDPPKRPPSKRRFLSDDEVDALVTEIPDRWKAFVLVAAYGGLRFGELCGLRLEHVNFLRRVVRVEDTIVEAGGKLHAGPTKSGAGRSVALPSFVVESLSEHVRRWPPGRDGLIFADSNGGPIWRSHFYKRVWWPAIRDARIGRLRFHDLRHTSAALAIAEGAHPKTIQMRLGHHSAAFTLDTYGGLFQGLDEELADKLDERRRRAGKGGQRGGRRSENPLAP